MGNQVSNASSFFAQSYLCGRPHWSSEDIPDLRGRTILITGGNSGTGKELAKYLLKGNAKVYLACRNEVAARQVINELKDLTGNEAFFLKLDLGELKSIKECVDQFMQKEQRLDLLFNNAAVYLPPKEHLTSNGCDFTFAVNVLGHFYLTKLLIPMMLSTYQETGIKPRVITVTSVMSYLTSLDLATLTGSTSRERPVSPTSMYKQSKLGNLLFGQELAERYGDQGITSIVVNPGNLRTNICRHLQQRGTLFEIFGSKVVQIYPAKWGGLQLLYAGTMGDGEKLNGKVVITLPYIGVSCFNLPSLQLVIPWARLGKPKRGVDPQLRKDLWQWLETRVEQQVV